MDYLEQYELVSKVLSLMGYKTTKPKKHTANGVDMFAIKGEEYVLSVEIKMACPFGKGKILRVKGVTDNRVNDDLIAIVFPSRYVLIEPMKDHLKCCSKYRERTFNF